MAIRILISYVTAGTGHRRAAEAIAEALGAHCPDAQVQCVDALDYTPPWFRFGYSWSYLLLVRHAPWIWKVSYALLDVGAVFRLVHPWRRAWNLFVTRRFVRWLAQLRPAVVVATHFLPADVCSAGKRAGWLRCPLVVVVTDWYPHRFWVVPESDATVVSTQSAAIACAQRGLAPARIHVVGIPIAQAFSAVMDRTALRGQLQLKADRQTVLVTSGGTTVGQFERVVESLAALEAILPQRLQLLIVCGQDERARRRLLKRAGTRSMPMRVFGFIDNMADLMAASDVIVAKAGGLTISEALGQGVPLILYHVIPGQERLNARYVAEHGAAVIAPRPRDVAAAVQRCVEDPDYLARLREAAKAAGRPNAADAIVSQVVNPLLQRGLTPWCGSRW